MALDRNLLANVVPFLVVAENLSFSRAASMLGLTPTAVSKAVRHLEQRHGVVLFQRTTRSVALTEAGAELYHRLKHTVAEVDHAFAVLSGFQDRPIGTFRLTCSRGVMARIVEPLVEDYRRACPEVTLDLSLNEGTVDLVAGNFDAGIRLGASVEKDMIAVRLTEPSNWSVVGNPAYFTQFPEPKFPEDLTEHVAVLYRFVTSGSTHKWEFLRDERQYEVEMKSRIIVNDRLSMISLARRGLGLAYVSDAEVAEDTATGQLKSILRDFVPGDTGHYLYFPSRAQTQPKLRAFIDLAIRHIQRSGANRAHIHGRHTPPGS